MTHVTAVTVLMLMFFSKVFTQIYKKQINKFQITNGQKIDDNSDGYFIYFPNLSLVQCGNVCLNKDECYYASFKSGSMDCYILISLSPPYISNSSGWKLLARTNRQSGNSSIPCASDFILSWSKTGSPNFYVPTDNDGWFIFHRRYDGSVEFYRNWTEYERGFGNLKGELWLGNTKLNYLTSDYQYELIVILQDWNGVNGTASYSSFAVGNTASSYQLTVGGYSGDVGDSFNPASSIHVLNGMKFTTFDRDNDNRNGGNCASQFHGAWWFNDCFASHLNGVVGKNEVSGLFWDSWRYMQSLKYACMKIRRKV